jgi:hypothetical protein
MLIPRHDAVNQLSDIGSVGWMQACRRIQPCGLNDWGVKACATVDRIDGVGRSNLRQQGTFGTFTSSQAVVTVDGSRWRARVPEEFAACSRQIPSVDVGVHTIRRFHAVQRGRCGGDSGADERWGQARWGMASLAKERRRNREQCPQSQQRNRLRWRRNWPQSTLVSGSDAICSRQRGQRLTVGRWTWPPPTRSFVAFPFR